jgi:hypothetical protein
LSARRLEVGACRGRVGRAEFGLQRRGATEVDGSRGGFGGNGGQLRLKILGCGWIFFFSFGLFKSLFEK